MADTSRTNRSEKPRTPDPAANKLVLAIDELSAFVAERTMKPEGGKMMLYFLDEAERQKLSDLEGKVIALRAKVAGGMIPHHRPTPKYAHAVVTPLTGLRLLPGGQRGTQISPSLEWTASLQALRSAAQAYADLEAIQPDKSTKSKRLEPNKGGRPSNDESPSRKKQRWCYEQYTHRPLKKLSRILEAAKAEFGKRAPKTEGQIITYATRWATHKRLPIPRRN